VGIAENTVPEENVENVETPEETVHEETLEKTLETPANLSDTHDTGIVVDVGSGNPENLSHTDDRNVKRRQLDAWKSDEQWFNLIGDEAPVINPIPLIHAITDNITNPVCQEAVTMAVSVSAVHLSYVTTYHNFLTLLTLKPYRLASFVCKKMS
jgi:hypothetical protein